MSATPGSRVAPDFSWPGEGTLRPGGWNRWGYVCLAVTAVALVMTDPWVESPVNDDFSYAKTAFELARTGQLTYNGWAAAMLGAQAYWGALFVKVFGETFVALRLSTMVLAVWSAGLLYSIHRRAGLTAGLASFGTLALTLSPLFIPNAVTFMTDVPALFFFLLSLHGCMRLDEVLAGSGAGPGRERIPVPVRAWGWVGFVVVVGIAGGSVRQTNFVVPVLGPAVVFWWRRDRVRFSVADWGRLAAALVLSVGLAVGLTSWFQAQPYSIHEKLSEGVKEFLRFRPVPLAVGILKIGLTCAAAILPLMWVLPSLWRTPEGGPISAARRGAIGAACLLPSALLWGLDLDSEGRPWYFPWMGNTFGAEPYLRGGGSRPPGDLPLVLPLPVFKLLSVAVLGLAGGTIVHGLMFPPMRWLRRGREWIRLQPAMVILLIAFAAFYLPLMLFKVFVPHSHGIWDRYLLPLLPLATVVTLGACQRRGRRQMPVGAWAVLIVFAAYGVAQIHDYFAVLRARTAITRDLENLGIERVRILGGFEYDGWTQISVAGYYNDPRIVHPAGSYQPLAPEPGFRTSYHWWRRHTPVITPDYVIAVSRHPDLHDTEIAPRDYQCWLPPFRGRIMVQVRDPKLARPNAQSQPGERRRVD